MSKLREHDISSSDTRAPVVSSAHQQHSSSRPPSKPQQQQQQRAPTMTSYFRNPSVDSFVAGVTAGSVSTLCLHPFDLIKTRMQVANFQVPSSVAAATSSITPPAATNAVADPSKRIYRHSLQIATMLVKEEGWSALYKGLSPNLFGNTVAWGLYFFGYDVVKRAFSESQPISIISFLSHTTPLPTLSSASSSSQLPISSSQARPRRPLNALEHILAASITGVCVSAITNPIWVVKTRMFLDHTPLNTSSLPPETRAKLPMASQMPVYRGMFDALHSIFKTEGIVGLYRGFIPGLFGVSHGAVQFMSYEELKKLLLNYKKRQRFGDASSSTSLDTAYVEWKPMETIAMSILSKSIASFSTYPYQVLRSRMQASVVPGLTLRSTIVSTWKNEGIRGFYRGCWINLIKVMPAACTVFVVYEQMNGYMKRHAKERTD